MNNMRMKIKSTARRAAFAMTAWSCAACAAFAADVKGNASDSAFVPAVTEDSTLVLGVNFTRQQLFGSAGDCEWVGYSTTLYSTKGDPMAL